MQITWVSSLKWPWNVVTAYETYEGLIYIQYIFENLIYYKFIKIYIIVILFSILLSLLDMAIEIKVMSIIKCLKYIVGTYLPYVATNVFLHLHRHLSYK